MITSHFSVLELFSGIGGMHAAMKETGKPFKVVGSFEINPVAITVYRHNYSEETKVSERNIMGMTTKMLEDFKPDVLLMSPPCQPFTRQGLKGDVKDTRCSPLLHILSLLEDARVIPKSILLENVAGFESSEAHTKLVSVLQRRNYVYQEFLLTPSQFGIPNSRLRYYLIAKVQPNTFCFETFQEVQSFFPLCTCYHYTQNVNEKDQKCSNCNKIIHQCVSRVIRNKFSEWHASHHTHSYPLDRLELSLSSFLKKVDDPRTYLVKKRDLLKYAKVFDIVHPTSRGSCCFTRGYAHYAQGTGSVIQHSQTVDLDEVFKTIQEIETTDPRYESLLSSLQLRYFTPREILKLMCFPQSFDIPQSCSIKQSYKALGNSINVFVVTLLLIILLD